MLGQRCTRHLARGSGGGNRREFASGHGTRGVRRGILKPQVLTGHLHARQARGEDEHDGRQSDRELGGDRAGLASGGRSNPASPGVAAHCE